VPTKAISAPILISIEDAEASKGADMGRGDKHILYSIELDATCGFKDSYTHGNVLVG